MTRPRRLDDCCWAGVPNFLYQGLAIGAAPALLLPRFGRLAFGSHDIVIMSIGGGGCVYQAPDERWVLSAARRETRLAGPMGREPSRG